LGEQSVKGETLMLESILYAIVTSFICPAKRFTDLIQREPQPAEGYVALGVEQCLGTWHTMQALLQECERLIGLTLLQSHITKPTKGGCAFRL
jgi:hypothetical protein